MLDTQMKTTLCSCLCLMCTQFAVPCCILTKARLDVVLKDKIVVCWLLCAQRYDDLLMVVVANFGVDDDGDYCYDIRLLQ